MPCLITDSVVTLTFLLFNGFFKFFSESECKQFNFYSFSSTRTNGAMQFIAKPAYINMTMGGLLPQNVLFIFNK